VDVGSDIKDEEKQEDDNKLSHNSEYSMKISKQKQYFYKKYNISF